MYDLNGFFTFSQYKKCPWSGLSNYSYLWSFVEVSFVELMKTGQIMKIWKKIAWQFLAFFLMGVGSWEENSNIISTITF